MLAQPRPVAYANWGGAYTTNRPDRITIGVLADGNAGTGTLETLFHEASRTMDRKLDIDLDSLAGIQGKRVPRDLSHAIIFYTAGELVRRIYPSHVPYAERFGLWTRVPKWSDYRRAISDEWQPYLEGKRSDADAVNRLIERVHP